MRRVPGNYKFLEVYEAGSGSLQELADQFRVSVQYAKKIRGQEKRSGQKSGCRSRIMVPISRVTEAAREGLRNWLRKQPDLTQAELRDRLQEIGVCVCKSRVGQVLQEMGLRRKHETAANFNGEELANDMDTLKDVILKLAN